MSIIYDALKKLEDTSGNGDLRPSSTLRQGNRQPRTKPSPVVYIAVIVVILTAIYAAWGLLMRPIRPTGNALAASAETKEILLERVKKNFVLNGIFYSGNKSYALLNNQIVAAGDTFAGVKVKKISADSIVLEKDGAVFTLAVSPR